MKKIDYNKLFPYTIGEDIANSVSHGVGAIIGAILFVYLIFQASTKGDTVAVVTFAIYGYAVIGMCLISCLYHGIRHVTTRDVFKRLDHSFIFILILSTYCPVIFVGIKTPLSYILFGLLSLMTIMGIVFKVFFVDKFKKLSTLTFVLMGWIALILIPQMRDRLSSEFLFFLVAGGLTYSIGAIIYAVGKFKYHHFIWHLFVLIAAFLHYYGIMNYLL